MSLYDLPKFNLPKIKRTGFFKNRGFWIIVLVILFSSFFGFLAGIFSSSYLYFEIREQLSRLNIELPEYYQPEKDDQIIYLPQTSQEDAIIQAVKEVQDSVVSIVITEHVELYYFTPFEDVELERRIEQREVGGGTGFIIGQDGLVLTNKHVVLRDDVDYSVLMNDGRVFPAQVLARDPAQDLAVIEIEQEGEDFPTVELGDSDSLRTGQTVIAIGNVLGEFQNSVSVGVISGLGRSIVASGVGLVQVLEDVIQTDAAINQGNSGGPLLNLKGEVIGINTAMVVGGENIGFAIPINKAKKGIEQVKTLGRIVYPFLGVRYVLINERVQAENDLPVDYGVLIIQGGPDEPAIFPGSAAQDAGLQEGDIILEFEGEKITFENNLARIIVRYSPGDSVTLKVLRNGQEMSIDVVLGERDG